MFRKWIGTLLAVTIIATSFIPAYAQETQSSNGATKEAQAEREVTLSSVSTKYDLMYGPVRYHVWGNGVNLRANHSRSSTVLEQIYAGEWVVEANFPAKTYNDGTYFWIRVKREKTGTIGWIVDDYIDYD